LANFAAHLAPDEATRRWKPATGAGLAVSRGQPFRGSRLRGPWKLAWTGQKQETRGDS